MKHEWDKKCLKKETITVEDVEDYSSEDQIDWEMSVANAVGDPDRDNEDKDMPTTIIDVSAAIDLTIASGSSPLITPIITTASIEVTTPPSVSFLLARVSDLVSPPTCTKSRRAAYNLFNPATNVVPTMMYGTPLISLTSLLHSSRIESKRRPLVKCHVTL